MSKKTIRVGIDNVVLDFTKRFIDCFEVKTGNSLSREDIDTWNFKDYINTRYNGAIDGNIANEMLLSGELITGMVYKKGSREALELMHSNERIQIVFVTALHESIAHLRKDWFSENLSDIDYELHFEIKKSRIKMDYLIDDGVHNLDELSKYISTEIRTALLVYG